MANQKSIRVSISAYQMEWVEQAKLRSDRGLPLDNGTLATLGEIFLDGLEE